MNDAAMAGNDSATGGDFRVLGIVHKFRKAGIEQPAAEAIAEEFAKLPTHEDMRREIRLALAEYHQKMVVLMLAMHGFTVALMTMLNTVIFLFAK